MSTNKKSSYVPGENVQFTINSTENSVVHLLTVDEGIYRSQFGFDLNIDNVSLPYYFVINIVRYDLFYAKSKKHSFHCCATYAYTVVVNTN